MTRGQVEKEIKLAHRRLNQTLYLVGIEVLVDTDATGRRLNISGAGIGSGGRWIGPRHNTGKGLLSSMECLSGMAWAVTQASK